MSSVDCPFCTIIAGEDADARVLYRGRATTGFFPLEPATRGHTLVVPNRHVTDLRDLTAAEGGDLGEAVRRVGQALRAALRPEGLNVIQSSGAVATQTVAHMHVHLVPRWSDDRMVVRWPEGAAEDGPAQDRTLAELSAVLPPEGATTSAEDRRQHLSFLQAVVGRMSEASSSCKTWLLPIVTLTYGYAITRKSVLVTFLGCLGVVVFGLLDANYLKQERSFRRLFDQVADGHAISAFSMNPAQLVASGAKVRYWPGWSELRSWAVAPIYGPLLLAGVGVAVWLLS